MSWKERGDGVFEGEGKVDTPMHFMTYFVKDMQMARIISTCRKVLLAHILLIHLITSEV